MYLTRISIRCRTTYLSTFLPCGLCREDSFSKNLELESVLPRFYFFLYRGRKKRRNENLLIFIPQTTSLSLTVFNIRKMYSYLLKLSVNVFVLLYRTSTLNVFSTFFAYYNNVWTISFTIVFFLFEILIITTFLTLYFQIKTTDFADHRN